MGFFICHQTFFSMNHTSLLQMPHLRVHHTGCPEHLGFHNTVAFNTLTNVKTEARDVKSPAHNSTGNTFLVLHGQATDVSVLN
jgi:hypothetical protein